MVLFRLTAVDQAKAAVAGVEVLCELLPRRLTGQARSPQVEVFPQISGIYQQVWDGFGSIPTRMISAGESPAFSLKGISQSSCRQTGKARN